MNYKVIKLTRGFETKVDNNDFDYLSKFTWHALVTRKGKVYAKTTLYLGNYKQKDMLMHRMIMLFPSGEIDHINGDSLDNRKENMRVGSHLQNLMNRPKSHSNRTGYKGVIKKNDKWGKSSYMARIGVDLKSINLGYYKTAIEAAIAYNKAAQEIYGEFAHLNQI